MNIFKLKLIQNTKKKKKTKWKKYANTIRIKTVLFILTLKSNTPTEIQMKK